MGQVFTWDSIQYGRIPKKESFLDVAHDLREQFSLRPSIVSAVLFGSYVRGNFTIRSDVNCFVIYKSEEEDLAMSAMQAANRKAHALHVPINFALCDTALAHTRWHHLDASFVQHLQDAIDAGGLIKGTLDGLLAPTVPATAQIESYIKVKLYRMQESFALTTSFSDDRLARFLTKTFEAPTDVARKMLIHEGTLRGDSKKEVQAEYRETMPKALSRQFEQLLAADLRYSAHLLLQVAEPDKDNYVDVLARLQMGVPRVLEFLRLNVLHLNHR
jgi:predicted nucleotidyltransferase